MSSPSETQVQQASSASGPAPVGSGERIMAAASQVKEIAQWMLENHPQRLVERVEAQALRIAELERQREVNQREIATLRSELAEAQRAGKRQAAPFRIAQQKRKQHCKRPGRKAGHPGAWRECPADEAVDEHIEVPLERCPTCGDTLDAAGQRVIKQTLIEVLPVIPRVIRLRTYRHHCDACQCEVESGHPVQVTRAVGAAGTHLGPRALGIAASLNQQLGLPMRKTTQVLEQLLGLKLSAGGLAQALQRVAARLQADYEELLVTLQTSAVLHIDETGWWVSGPGYWLWVVTNEQGTYYRIVPNRDRETAASLVGEEFAGVLVSDCLNIYDDLNTHV
ncbi:MAG: IS66 family transposase [Elainellaceae cyanobacterium]